MFGASAGKTRRLAGAGVIWRRVCSHAWRMMLAVSGTSAGLLPGPLTRGLSKRGLSQSMAARFKEEISRESTMEKHFCDLTLEVTECHTQSPTIYPESSTQGQRKGT